MTGEIDNLSELRWEQSYLCLCAGPGEASDYLQTVHHLTNHLLIIFGVLLVDTLNLGIFTKGNLPLRCISPSTWGNQRRARSNYHLSHISIPPWSMGP